MQLNSGSTRTGGTSVHSHFRPMGSTCSQVGEVHCSLVDRTDCLESPRTCRREAAPVVANESRLPKPHPHAVREPSPACRVGKTRKPQGVRRRPSLTLSPEAGARGPDDAREPAVPDARVAAALAAMQANWYASRQAWAEAALAYDRLLAADPNRPEAWLRTPGLLRLATALVHQDRPGDAVPLLSGGAKRRTDDGLPAAENRVAVGLLFSTDDGEARVTEVLPGSPAEHSALRAGDVVTKVNEIELNAATVNSLSQLLKGETGTKVRLTVRHVGNDRLQVIELKREKFLNDKATRELLQPLWVAINERLASNAQNAPLLELRAELAGQWSDSTGQVADYTAAIEVLSEQNPEPRADLPRLHGRRGHAHIALRQWQQAVNDYARCVTDDTTDELLLTNQALARAEVMMPAGRWTAPKPIEAKSELGSILSILPDDSFLASGPNPLNDRYRIVLALETAVDLAAVRLEALTHPSLPKNGPGRHPTGNYAQWSWTVTAMAPDQKAPITLEFADAWSDQAFQYPIQPNGHFNIFGGGEGRDCSAVWALSKPVSLAVGTKLTFEMKFKSAEKSSENLGHFRLSISNDPTVIQRESKYLPATKLADPLQKLAVLSQLEGKEHDIDQMVERHPKFAARIGDAFIQGSQQDWQRAVEIYSRAIRGNARSRPALESQAGSLRCGNCSRSGLAPTKA